MKKGFTLIEVLVALFIITIGVGGSFVLIQRTLVFSSQISFQLRGSYLAQEGVELVRNVRDSNFLDMHKGIGGNWNDGMLICDLGCEMDYKDSSLVSYLDRYLKEDGDYYAYDTGIDTLFKRRITIISISANQIDVSVQVTWEERGRSGSIMVSTQLFDWLNPS